MVLQQTLTMLDRAKSSSSSSKADVMNEVECFTAARVDIEFIFFMVHQDHDFIEDIK